MGELHSAMMNALSSLVSFLVRFPYFHTLFPKLEFCGFRCFLICAQLKSPVLVAVILVTGIGGMFLYSFKISVLTAPSVMSSSVCSENKCTVCAPQLAEHGIREKLKDLL